MSNKQFTTEVDVPPSINNLYFTPKHGKHRVMTKEGKKYKKDAGWLIKAAALDADWKYQKGQRLNIVLDLIFRDRRRRDITNCIKIVEDAASEVLGFDDTVVDSFLVRRMGIDRNRPHARLTIAESL